VYEIGEFVQLPLLAVSCWPSFAMPEILGSVVFAGGRAVVVVVLTVVVAVVVVVLDVDADPIATELASPAPMTNASPKARYSNRRMRGVREFARMRVICDLRCSLAIHTRDYPKATVARYIMTWFLRKLYRQRLGARDPLDELVLRHRLGMWMSWLTPIYPGPPRL
jgi:hypothetical protein